MGDIVKAGVHDTHRTLIFTGRPLRIIKNKYTENWEENRREEMQGLLKSGKIPSSGDIDLMERKSKGEDVKVPVGLEAGRPNSWLSGQVAGAITDILPAKTIVESMVEQAAEVMKGNMSRVSFLSSKL